MNLREKFNCVSELSSIGINYPFLAKEIANLITHVISSSDELTSHEIELGIHKGKLSCVKAYRDRTGKDLITSKRICEKHFADHSLSFKG